MRHFVLALWLALVTGPALAASDTDRADTRAVIERQIEAFKRDDGAAAYALAAPGIRTLFPNADSFMSMVKNGYQPVYRPRAYEFGQTVETENGVLQSLTVEDADGVDWNAVYTLEKEPDGSWKITGCRLERAGSTA